MSHDVGGHIDPGQLATVQNHLVRATGALRAADQWPFPGGGQAGRALSSRAVLPEPTLNIVLDTNVVLDWLLFRDPATEALAAGVQTGRITLLTHGPALDELRRVLTYPQFALDEPRQRALRETYVLYTKLARMPDGFAPGALLLPPGFPQCRDADDQPFLALAFHAQADALVSKDRDVLKLRRRARRFGVPIVTIREISLLLQGMLNGS